MVVGSVTVTDDPSDANSTVVDRVAPSVAVIDSERVPAVTVYASPSARFVTVKVGGVLPVAASPLGAG